MKKTVSILLALTMLFALCVPSFAATQTITQADTPTTSTVTTLTQKAPGTGDAETLQVEIPADQEIYWGTETVDMGCTITTQLMTGKTVTVEITDPGKFTKDALTPITYQATGSKTHTTGGPVVTNEAMAYELNTFDWTKSPIDTYTAQFTYTITVNPAS